jgi:hypothetical protein
MKFEYKEKTKQEEPFKEKNARLKTARRMGRRYNNLDGLPLRFPKKEETFSFTKSLRNAKGYADFLKKKYSTKK